MGGIDFGDAPRLQASEVALNPQVGDALNVQDALGAAATLTSSAEDTTADDPTTVAYNAGSVTVPMLVAVPPVWLDDAGNIIATGQYQMMMSISPGVAPTAPGLYGIWTFYASVVPIPADGLADFEYELASAVFNVETADLPFPLASPVHFQTDATGTAFARGTIRRLASGVPSPS